MILEVILVAFLSPWPMISFIILVDASDLYSEEYLKHYYGFKKSPLLDFFKYGHRVKCSGY